MFPVKMTIRDGHTFVLTPPTLSEAAVTCFEVQHRPRGAGGEHTTTAGSCPAVTPWSTPCFCVSVPWFLSLFHRAQRPRLTCGLERAVLRRFLLGHCSRLVVAQNGHCLHLFVHTLIHRYLLVRSRENTTFGTLSCDYAATIRLVNASKVFLSEEELGRVALSFRFTQDLLCDQSVQPSLYRGHHWLHNLPLLRHLILPGTFAWPYGCPIRGTTPWVSVSSSEWTPHT